MSESEVLYMRSSKKDASKSSGGDSSTNEDDIWDDTLLVEAYDRAVQYAQQNYVKKKQGASKPGSAKSKVHGSDSHAWKVGDRCSCQYSEDLNYYEADIIDVINSTGRCVVKYVGYENEETVSLKSLKPSEGDFIRFRQIQQAASESAGQNTMKLETDTLSNGGRKSHKKLTGKKKDCFMKNNSICAEGSNSFLKINSPFPQGLNGIMPPPPPPHMFNNISDDDNENEAMSAMLISWYMSGYHTGYYQGLKMGKKQEQ